MFDLNDVRLVWSEAMAGDFEGLLCLSRLVLSGLVLLLFFGYQLPVGFLKTSPSATVRSWPILQKIKHLPLLKEITYGLFCLFILTILAQFFL